MSTPVLMPSPRQRFFDSIGLPLVNGYVFTFAAGTSDKLAAFTDPAGLIPHTNPIKLDERGEATIYWLGNYKVDVRDEFGLQVRGYPVDNFNAPDNDALSGSLFSTFLGNTGASLIGYLAAGAGAIKRTVQDVLRDFPATVKNYGVKADGATDDTIALQRAANASKDLRLPEGSIVVTGTIQLQAGAKVLGAGMLKTRVQRKGVWAGPTFRIGLADGSAGAYDCEIGHMLIEQLHPGYQMGVSTSMVDRLTAEQSHIDCFSGYNANFHDLWFEHGVYGISLWGCVITKISDIRSFGAWDTREPGVCEQKAVIRLACDNVTPGLTFCTETRIERVYIGTGRPSPTRTITVGNITFQGTENVGSKCAVLVNACEGLSIVNGYMGGCAEDCIQFVPQAITSQIRIDNMFFDESFTSNIRFYPGSTPAVAVTIGPLNTFNGTLRTRNAIIAENNAGQPTVIGMVITGGEYNNFMETPIVLNNARAVTITGTMVNNYNCRGSTANTVTIYSGIYVDSLCREIHINGGLYGGGTNNWDYANNCKWGPYFAGGSASGTACNVRSILGVSGGATVGGLSQIYPT